MKRKLDKWNTAKGIMDELHRIREEMNAERKRMGDEAWLKYINQSSARLGFPKRRKKATARA